MPLNLILEHYKIFKYKKNILRNINNDKKAYTGLLEFKKKDK